MSPDFPKRYPVNIDCLLYTFVGQPDEIVELTFHQFNLRRHTDGSGQCYKLGSPKIKDRASNKDRERIEVISTPYDSSKNNLGY
ncbi:hypothetical protein KQX54_011010 [Cotesia glomerata]|uniref:CUB domain-containing protein n=1 Tax=Cotesia glomerata TaxID=32391 RepID=A0AAV7INR7_COTGL|nr:hypothetical protein KQX54_011010 [Cotesia glomerata]